ncbi:YjcQ family protein [Lactobacillus corticis]|uniref:YjcQ protein n=1 Tax=Lactobacillus corticis TaxID=2201249 RepID=A0A916QKK0_9LACO|nr:YjcQ family protein [Lactobacillus corticis]GFZ27250.1 hypothetical protein LCB40_11300 [Lactobacillus corticis]
MARDDYFVLVYKLLKILYLTLKSGKAVTSDELKELSEGIPLDYWEYILKSLYEEGYVTGVISVNTLSGSSIKVTNLQITPKGIEYLQDNSKMQKAAEFVKNLPQWISLIAKFA